MTEIRQALDQATAHLTASGLDAAESRREAQILVAAAMEYTTSALIAWPERALTCEQHERLRQWLERRGRGEPIAYLLQRRAFWTLELEVTPATLIPRPETELIVDWALNTLPADTPLCCADLGTGSGAIALALAVERPRWRVLALDRSAAALAVAQRNAQRYSLANLDFVQGDWLAAIGQQRLDVIVANPPYIADNDPHLAQGDLRFEPRLALAIGDDGLDAMRCIIATLAHCLVAGGYCALEHGWGQAAAVRALLAAAGLVSIEQHRDLAGIERFVTARRPD